MVLVYFSAYSTPSNPKLLNTKDTAPSSFSRTNLKHKDKAVKDGRYIYSSALFLTVLQHYKKYQGLAAAYCKAVQIVDGRLKNVVRGSNTAKQNSI